MIDFEVLESILDQHQPDPDSHNDEGWNYCMCGATWSPGHALLALIGDTSEFGVIEVTPLSGLVALPAILALPACGKASTGDES